MAYIVWSSNVSCHNPWVAHLRRGQMFAIVDTRWIAYIQERVDEPRLVARVQDDGHGYGQHFVESIDKAPAAGYIGELFMGKECRQSISKKGGGQKKEASCNHDRSKNEKGRLARVAKKKFEQSLGGTAGATSAYKTVLHS